MNKRILEVGLIANIAIVAFLLFVILGGFFIDNEAFNSFVHGDLVSQIRFWSSFLVFLFWGYLIFLWSKYDKHVGRFFALFFLIGWYSIFYAYRMLKKIG